MKVICCLILGLSAWSAVALDLSPSFINVFADGVAIRRPYFTDGGKKYAVTLNAETELSSSGDGALFKFIKLQHAEMRLRPSAFSTDLKFGPDTLDRYQEAARKLLPQNAEGVTLDQQVKNPLPINGWDGYRFVYKYTTPAGEMRESITFLNILPSQQVIIQIYAPQKDFADASERGFDIIRRWHELDSTAAPRGN